METAELKKYRVGDIFRTMDGYFAVTAIDYHLLVLYTKRFDYYGDAVEFIKGETRPRA